VVASQISVDQNCLFGKGAVMKAFINRALELSLSGLLNRLILLLNACGMPPLAVPTVTVIAFSAADPHMVLFIRHQKNKHGGKLTLVGGKYPLRKQISALAQLLIEWWEEAGGDNATLLNPELWAIKTDHRSGHRFVTLEKATDGDCPRWLRKLRVEAFFGVPDRLFAAMVQGNPAPNHAHEGGGKPEDLAEARDCVWIDTRTIRLTADKNASGYGAQHDLVAKVWCYVLDGRMAIAIDTFDDFDALRERLLSMQSSETGSLS
jgi:hypothetical protein